MADDPRGIMRAGPAAFLCRPAGDFARLLLRGPAPALDAASASLDMIPPVPLRVCQGDAVTLLWLGPDEVLLLAPAAHLDAIAGRLEAALQPHPHSLVAVADRQVALDLSGTEVATVLNAGCPLDLSEAAFPAGMCTRTLLGKAEIVLWRQAPRHFHLEVWRSFAPYVEEFLDQAARDQGARGG